MRDDNEIKSKRAYWSGVYYALDPANRGGSHESQREWVTAQVWLTALDWVLGRATDSTTTLGGRDDAKGWDG